MVSGAAASSSSGTQGPGGAQEPVSMDVNFVNSILSLEGLNLSDTDDSLIVEESLA